MEDKKISMVETMFLVLFVVPLDALELIAGLIPGISYLAIGYDLAAMAGLMMFFHMKGGNIGLTAGANGIETLLPGVDALPIRTVALVVAIYTTNHPKSALAKAAKAVPTNGAAAGAPGSSKTHSQPKANDTITIRPAA